MGALTGGNYLYLNVSGGKLVNKKKGMALFGYEGTLTAIRRKEDEYEGQPVQKIELEMRDNKSDEVARISFTEESWYSQGFFARITGIDLSRPFVVGASGSDKNEKVSFCWLKQGQDTIKSEKGSFPGPEKNSRGKMTYDKMLDAIDPILANLQEKLGSATVAETDGQTQEERAFSQTRNIQPNPATRETKPKADDKIYGTVPPDPMWGNEDVPF